MATLPANRPSAATLLRLALLLVLALLWVAPVAWMVLTSLKPEGQIVTLPPRWLPDRLGDFTLEHYREVLLNPRNVNLAQAFRNSVVVALLGTALTVVVDVLAGYALARLRFPGRDVLFGLVVASLIMPAEVLLIPNFVTAWRLGWLNSPTALVVPVAATGFGVFLMRQFLLTIPRELEDAATVDGCGSARILWSIMLPLARNGVVTLAIFTFLHYWNDFTWPLIVINEGSQLTLPVALLQFRGGYTVTNYGQLMAGTAFSALPAILVFLLAQGLIIRSITLTGVKG